MCVDMRSVGCVKLMYWVCFNSRCTEHVNICVGCVLTGDLLDPTDILGLF